MQQKFMIYWIWSSVDNFRFHQSTHQVFPLRLSHLILVSAANGWKFSCFWLFQPFIFEFSFCGILRESLRSDVVGTWDINPTKLFPPLFPCTCQFFNDSVNQAMKNFSTSAATIFTLNWREEKIVKISVKNFCNRRKKVLSREEKQQQSGKCEKLILPSHTV